MKQTAIFAISDTIHSSFATTMKEIIDDMIVPKHGNKLTMDILTGFFTTDQYGSHRIDFKDEQQNIVCYVIADVILGEYKIYGL